MGNLDSFHIPPPLPTETRDLLFAWRQECHCILVQGQETVLSHPWKRKVFSFTFCLFLGSVVTLPK